MRNSALDARAFTGLSRTLKMERWTDRGDGFILSSLCCTGLSSKHKVVPTRCEHMPCLPWIPHSHPLSSRGSAGQDPEELCSPEPYGTNHAGWAALCWVLCSKIQSRYQAILKPHQLGQSTRHHGKISSKSHSTPSLMPLPHIFLLAVSNSHLGPQLADHHWGPWLHGAFCRFCFVLFLFLINQFLTGQIPLGFHKVVWVCLYSTCLSLDGQDVMAVNLRSGRNPNHVKGWPTPTPPSSCDSLGQACLHRLQVIN